jgi:L-asparaginase
VEVVWVVPGLTPRSLERRLNDPDVRGVVLATFGVGTIPANGIDGVVRDAIASGIEVLVTTQWGGVVDLGAYRNSKPLREAGALEGGEMHIEAAVPKLMHALAIFERPAERQAWLVADVAGERA